MKKIFILTILSLALLAPFTVMAQTPPAAADPTINSLLDQTAGTGAAGYETSVDDTSLARTVGMIVRTAISLIGIIFVCYTIYAGFLYMLSAGNDEKIEKAKAMIKNGIIGIIVILFAGAIYVFIMTLLLTGTTPVTTSH